LYPGPLMNRVAYALSVACCFMMGMLLVYLPWMRLWEHNYFLSRFPGLVRVALHPSLRGAVTGLGLLDILLAVGMIHRRPRGARDARN
jgi:hypothetical protein